MPVPSPPYPVNLLVEGRRVLVVGGGSVAAAKVRGLLAAGAVVHVVASEVSPEVRDLGVAWDERAYERGDLTGCWLAVACTDDPAANQAVFDDGEAAGVWVNAADDPDRCSYTLPARAHRGPLLVTVSTSGHSPALAAWLRDELASTLGPEHDTLLALLAEARAALAAEGRRSAPADWRQALDSGMLDLIRSGRTTEARALLHGSLGLVEPPSSEHR
ncbi:MAG: precorrin-2 dehydrogenase/sirohydrochlorin ferrochelatase family protein [Microthrixaceae bacterium]